MSIVIKNPKAVFTQILFKIEENPTQKIKTESGIILANMHKSDETGNFENSNNLIGFGIVEAVGPDVKYIKQNDAIYFLKGSIRPLPVGEEIWNISEQQVIAFIDSNEPSLQEARVAYKEAKDADLKSAMEYQKNQPTKEYAPSKEIDAIMERARKADIFMGNTSKIIHV